ncbi:hypothetical protein AAC387_Pa02g0760 [Persea americana]
MGSLMGLIGSVIVVIAALAQCIAAETTHNVGDSAGWTIPFNTSWASGKTFAAGDKLSFTFNAQAHDVALVTKTEYEGRTNTSNSSVSTTSPTIIILNATEPSSPSPPPTAGSGSSPPPPATSSTSSPPPPPRTPSSTPSPPPAPPPSLSSPSTSSGVSTGIIVGVSTAGILAVVVVLGLIIFCCRKKRRRQHDPSDHYRHAAPVPPSKGAKNDAHFVRRK